jgi:hypothetical protein
MKIILPLISIFWGIYALNATAQIKGQVISQENQMPVEFANVTIEDTFIGVMANNEGEFALHIPVEHKGKNIIISRLGFTSDTIFSFKPNQKVLVTLAPQQIQLSEIVVKPINPLNILRKAVRKIPENYSCVPVYLHAYYRELIKTDDAFVKYADAACRIYYCGYETPFDKTEAGQKFYYLDLKNWGRNTPFPQAANSIPHQCDAVQILATRKSNDLENFVNRWDFEEGLKKFDISGGPLRVTAADLVKLRKDIVDTTTWKHYRFRFEGLLGEEERNRVYKISFEPKGNNENAIWRGILYIDEKSDAFMEFEYSVSEKGEKYLKEKDHERIIDLKNEKIKKELNKSSVKRVIKHTNQSVTIKYSDYGGKWYLSYIKITNDIENSGDIFDTIIYNTYMELFVNNIQFHDIMPLSEENIFNTNNFVYLYHYPAEYSPSFWETYNTPVPTGEFRKALMDLGKEKSLQKQFQEKSN